MKKRLIILIAMCISGTTVQAEQGKITVKNNTRKNLVVRFERTGSCLPKELYVPKKIRKELYVPKKTTKVQRFTCCPSTVDVFQKNRRGQLSHLDGVVVATKPCENMRITINFKLMSGIQTIVK